ncbi:MAG TPA: NAD(+)/NADH kinase, partial [Phycisphaerae bacterium]|nr:NAD(+)/NADH kinase [Phycisphaerae bacterium]
MREKPASTRPKVIILRNPTKPAAEAKLASLIDCLSQRAEVIATGVVGEPWRSASARPDRVIVLGGDGSILAVVREMGDEQIPVVGVNFGKLGYLAEFSIEDLARNLDAVLSDDSIVSRRMMIDAVVTSNGGEIKRDRAVNDCVVHAGPPYRMIELS